MSIQDCTVVEIRSVEDSLLPDWLELYELSFPPRERILISEIIRALQKQKMGVASPHVMLALVAPEERLVGIGMYMFVPELPVAYVWYLAITPKLRNQGLGTRLYRLIVDRVFEKCRLMLFEVEKPEEALSAEEAELSRRRIEFYRRNGALLLTGISYYQSVGDHCPPTPMHIMVHLREPMSPQETYKLAKKILGNSIEQIGPLAFA